MPRLRRIVIVQPCCIGDVVLATAALRALRRVLPSAWIAWAVGAWSRPVLDAHPDLDAVIDAGPGALPRSPADLVRLAGRLRSTRADTLISLVRSPRISVAALLTGIPVRAGLDSGGRGFGYTVRVPVTPDAPRHEAELYLDVVRALGIDADGVRTFVPVHDADRDAVRAIIGEQAERGYLVVHAGGGRNPGMVMDSKRYPPSSMAALAARLAARLDCPAIVIGGADDAPLVDAVTAGIVAHGQTAHGFAGAFSFGQIGALAADARLYVGNDTGLTHYAAAAGGRTVMILGPSDPRRYAPFSDHALALWQPTAKIAAGGVSAGPVTDWDWERDGIPVDTAEARIVAWLRALK